MGAGDGTIGAMGAHDSPWLVVGLGNPGAQYALTRHNAGRLTLEVLCARVGARPISHRTRTHVAEVRLGTLPGGAPGPRVVLATADSYMNTSGGPLSALSRFLGVGADHLLVVHDDLDLPAHDLRLKKGGGEGGHRGLLSLSQSLGTRDYHRLRIGIGRPPGRQDPADFVLAPLPPRERPDWDVTFEQAADAVEDVVLRGFAEAQQALHSR